MELIKLSNITKEYGTTDNKTYALRGVSLDISEGEMLAIMGASGSGKSTLVQIIGCLDNATSGEYFLENIDTKQINSYMLAKIRNEKIGFIFQQFALIQSYTAMENVSMPLIYGNIYKSFRNKESHKKIHEKATEKLEMVGLFNHRNKYPSQLSGGQQQRVAIARALINNPKIIIADEPTGALDQNTGNEIMNLFCDINHSNKTVIVVTHDSNVANYCKRLINIKDGKVTNLSQS